MPDVCKCDQVGIDNLRLGETIKCLTLKLEESETRHLQVIQTLRNALKMRTSEIDSLKKEITKLRHSSSTLQEKLDNFHEQYALPSSIGVSMIRNNDAIASENGFAWLSDSIKWAKSK